MHAGSMIPTTPSGGPEWLVCSHCGATCRDRLLSPGEHLHCGRCHAHVKSTPKGGSFHSLWAFSSAGIISLILANTNPILHFEVAGKSQENLVITGIEALWNDGYGIIAVQIFICTIAAPALYLSALWYLAASRTLGTHWPGTDLVARTAANLENLNLLPVFAVACLVSVVKLQTIGTVTWDSGALWIAIASLFTLLSMQAHKPESPDSNRGELR